ncbi:hypothetical protein [Paraflavitalea speifideaquila]|uniref:hypothetical protein n=1 Tax=Paraflavitalea speifideaquila TaxID=3076558 RepID=UPI0028EBEA4E|nr:hypothetical protein [Paraflavitalea speifideiaquila]
MKQLLTFIAILCTCKTTSASNLDIKTITDTTIAFTWKENGERFKLEISLIGEAGPDGVIPGQTTKCYISLKKAKVSPKQNALVLKYKDTCNPQVSQLLFYDRDLVRRIIAGKSEEFFFFYEFGSDGLDPRTIKYIVVGKDRVYSSIVRLVYDEEKMSYEPATPLLKFLNALPEKYKHYARQDYKKYWTGSGSQETENHR